MADVNYIPLGPTFEADISRVAPQEQNWSPLNVWGSSPEERAEFQRLQQLYQSQNTPYSNFLLRYMNAGNLVFTENNENPYWTQRQRPTLRELLSFYVIDAMGYTPKQQTIYGAEANVYTWGELATIFQQTPAVKIAQRVSEYEAAGDWWSAGLIKAFYGATQRAPEPGTGQQDVDYPLAEPSPHPQTPAPGTPGQQTPPSAIDVYLPQIRTGQRDVRIEPALVASILENRQIERQGARRRHYTSAATPMGSELTSVLGTLNIGRQRLGG